MLAEAGPLTCCVELMAGRFDSTPAPRRQPDFPYHVGRSLHSVLAFYSDGLASWASPGLFLVPSPPLETSLLLFSSHTRKTTAPPGASSLVLSVCIAPAGG